MVGKLLFSGAGAPGLIHIELYGFGQRWTSHFWPFSVLGLVVFELCDALAFVGGSGLAGLWFWVWSSPFLANTEQAPIEPWGSAGGLGFRGLGFRVKGFRV